MSETIETFRDMAEQRKARHKQWNAHNRQVLVEANMIFTDKGETLLFRESGKPQVDFYPSTGRWKVDGIMYSGGAKRFLEWYQAQPVAA